MYNLEFSFLNGRLLYVNDEKSFIGYDPIFSEPMNYPADNSWDIKRAEYNVSLDGETFNVRVKYQSRRTIGGLGLLGLEVFLDEKHMTTYLSFSSMPEYSKHGSKWFFHNDSYYLISGGWNFYKHGSDTFHSFDNIPMEKKYQKVDKEKLYLVKFKSFVCEKPYSQNMTIEKIITTLFVKNKTWSPALLKALEAWDLKPFERLAPKKQNK